MKKIFTPEVRKILFESVFITLLVFLSQNYLQKLWAPSTAAETLRKENYISSKKETYFEALNLVNRRFSELDFHVAIDTAKYKRLNVANLPSEFEVNSCLAKLYIYSDNPDLINSFKKIFIFRSGDSSTNMLGLYVDLLKSIKKDLGTETTDLIDNYEYIFVSDSTSKK